MIDSREALARLVAGNRRFVSDRQGLTPNLGEHRRRELVGGQEPFAIILGCSDSRVPAEMIFDQGLGDLFVVRVAGNVVAPSQVGSVEFAADRFGTQLVVVLGHTMCGAVQATLEEFERPQEKRSPALHSIVSRIRASIGDEMAGAACGDPEEELRRAVRANIRASVRQLGAGSETIAGLIRRGRLLIAGAEYALDTGVVDFFDAAPDGVPARS